MGRGKTEPREVRVCIHCRRATFDPHQRDVSDWPLIDDLNASDHCRTCWMELAKMRGRALGDVGLRELAHV